MNEIDNGLLWMPKLEFLSGIEASTSWFEATSSHKFSKNDGVLVMVNINSVVERILLVEKGKLCETVSGLCNKNAERCQYLFKMLYAKNKDDAKLVFEEIKAYYKMPMEKYESKNLNNYDDESKNQKY